MARGGQVTAHHGELFVWGMSLGTRASDSNVFGFLQGGEEKRFI